MKAPLKVLFLARWYPDRYDPMIGLFVKRHAETAAIFADVAVLYLRAVPEKPKGFLIDQKVENQVTRTIVYYGTQCSFPYPMVKVRAAFLFVIAFFRGYRFVLETWGNPALIHVNVLTRIGLLALYLKIFKKINYVITEHWSRYLPQTGTYKGLFRKIATKLIVSNASAVSTVSINLAKAMQLHGLKSSNYLILPNVVDTELYTLPEQTNNNPLIRIIHVSCFEDKSKNISGILRMLSSLSQLRSDFECIMVGEGIDLQKMKKLAAELNLNPKILQFAGLLENEKLVEMYQSADFMLMFSNYENMPVVISESFSCGIPVVATAVGGIPEYVNAENGLLVKAGDEEALLKSVMYMLDNYRKYNRTAIRNSAIKEFSKNSVMLRLKELYSHATNRIE